MKISAPIETIITAPTPPPSAPGTETGPNFAPHQHLARKSPPRIFMQSLDRGYLAALRAGFEWTGFAREIRPGTRIAIKPNLTFPVFRRGVMTNPEALEAVILYLKDYTSHITICESDSGGYNPFSMSEVFARTGIDDFARRHGVRVVNLSGMPSRDIRVQAGLRRLRVPLPTMLLDETDIFITMPVPKVHANAIVSLSMKNQWGVIQQPSQRLKLHPYFKEVIYAVNRALPRSFAVFDGKFGLNRNGPMRGDAVELNWLLLSDNFFVSDALVAGLLGFDWHEVPHLRYALKKESISSISNIECNTDYRAFQKDPFILRREWTDYPGLITFHSRLMAYLGYESPLAKPLHWLLYKFREPFY
jgi:uncharacterized protein (DUF362 family)